MSLEKCNECNSLMSNKASACLNCGYPIASRKPMARASGNSPRVAGQTGSAYEKWRDMVLFGTFISVLVLIGMMISRI